jgi:Helix-turn-helix.
MAASKGTKVDTTMAQPKALDDLSFRAEWQRLASAREFAVTLLRYRVEHRLNQRQLADQLGVSRQRVVQLESGEDNPEDDTIATAMSRLGIEFASSST